MQIHKSEKAKKIRIDNDESHQAEERGFSPAQILVLVTSLKQPVPAGAIKLDVCSHADCQPGMLITLTNPNESNLVPEHRWIIAIVVVVILDRPLERAHGEGTIVTVTKNANNSSSVLDNDVDDNLKYKASPNLAVTGLPALATTDKSDRTASAKSTTGSMFVSGKRNHSNRIYPIDYCLTVEPSSLSKNDHHHPRFNEMNAVREAERMRLEAEEEEEEEEADRHVRQLEQERRGREAAMQRRLQSASLQESKRCMQKKNDEEEEADQRVFVKHREELPSVEIVGIDKPPATVPTQRPLAAVEQRETDRLEQDLSSAGAQTMHWDDGIHHHNHHHPRVNEMNAVREAEEEEEEADRHVLQLEEERREREAAMQRRLQSASLQESKRRMQQLKKNKEEEEETDQQQQPAVVEVQEELPSEATVKPSSVEVLVIDKPPVTVPTHRPLAAVEQRESAKWSDGASRWEQNLSSASAQTMYWDDYNADDDDNLTNFNPSISKLLERRMNARYSTPLRLAQSAQTQSPYRSNAIAATSAVAAIAATSSPTKVPSNIGTVGVHWDDLSALDASIDSQGDSQVGLGHNRSHTDNDSSLRG